MRTTGVLPALYIAILMLSLGLELGLEQGEPKRAKWLAVTRGLLLNIVLIPMVMVLIVRLWQPKEDLRLALLLLALTPGGRYTPHVTRVARADTAIALEIMLFSLKVTAFTAPLAARRFLGVSHLEISDLSLMLQMLLLQLLPFYVGKTVRRHRGELADRLQVPLRRFVNIVAIVLVVYIVVHQHLRGLTFLADRGWLTLLSFAVVAGGLGWLLGWPTSQRRQAFAISTVGRNGALALMIAALGFPTNLGVQWAIIGSWLSLLLLNYTGAMIVGRRMLLTRLHGPTLTKPAAPA